MGSGPDLYSFYIWRIKNVDNTVIFMFYHSFEGFLNKYFKSVLFVHSPKQKKKHGIIIIFH